MALDLSTLSPQEQIASLFVGYFDRAPAPSGLNYWVGELTSGRMTITQIAESFGNQPEAIGLYPLLGAPNLVSDQGYLDLVTDIFDNLLGRPPANGLNNYYVQELINGADIGQVIIDIISGAQGADKTLLENKIEVGLDWSQSALAANVATVDNPLSEVVNGQLIILDQDAYDSARNVLDGVTDDAATVAAAKAATDAFFGDAAGEGETFFLTSGLDNVAGTGDNDTIIGLVEADAADVLVGSTTFTLGDNIDGKSGVDTLRIFSDTEDKLSLFGKTILNVENLEIFNANVDLNSMNLANKAFENVLIDFGGDENLSGFDVNNINAASAVVLDNLGFYDDDVNLNFASSSAATGVTDITVSDEAVDDMNINIDATFTSATDYTFNLNISDFDANDNFNVNANIELGAPDLMLEVNVNFDNMTTDTDGYFDLEFDTNGVEMATVNVTMTDTNLNEFYIDIDDSNNGTGTEDVANITLTDVEIDDNLEVDHVEFINMVINGDVFIDDMEFYDYEGDQTLNIVANGNLVIENDLNMNDNAFNQTVTITGAGNVDLGDLDLANDANTTQIVDASLATGNITVYDSNSALDTFTSNTGDDSLTLGWIGTTANMGAGDDFVDTNGYDYGAAGAGKLDGGADIDTIGIDDAANLDAGTAANISNFEILEIGGGTGAYDLSVESSLTGVSIRNDAVAAGATSVVGAATTGATLEFIITDGSDDTLSDDTFSLALDDDTGTNDSLAISFLATDVDTDVTAEGQITAGLTADGIETINITSDAETLSEESAPGADDALTSADYTNTFTFVGDDAETINIDGNAKFDLTLGTATAASMVVELIDATANTAGVTIDASTQNGGVGVNTVAISFDGSDAADSFTATANGDVLQGNGGADEFFLDAIAANAVEETIRYEAATDSQITLVDGDDDGDADTFSGQDAISGFVAGEDTIELSSLLGLATGDARSALNQLGTFPAAEDLADVFEGFGADFFNDGLVDRAVAFGTDGTDGYVFVDANADGDFNAADDMVIELTGVTALTIGDFSFG
ncbi:DUF4214 domain-containing protein [uncultured Marivita sp.]|uniref:DUF4214 domain-containing protein n=1 Tax=uncultured Marivita sp. TaxID=888080 RepID=UPI0026322D03|nr:DUF4214 domain-containing protein [uncultured Marivita sp.]